MIIRRVLYYRPINPPTLHASRITRVRILRIVLYCVRHTACTCALHPLPASPVHILLVRIPHTRTIPPPRRGGGLSSGIASASVTRRQSLVPARLTMFTSNSQCCRTFPGTRSIAPTKSRSECLQIRRLRSLASTLRCTNGRCKNLRNHHTFCHRSSMLTDPHKNNLHKNRLLQALFCIPV